VFQVLTGEALSPALDPYRRGRDLMQRRRWRDAIEAFEAAVVADPDDRPSALMLDRARILARKPPASDWDGVWETAEAA
jgi:adenylate cyclase